MAMRTHSRDTRNPCGVSDSPPASAPDRIKGLGLGGVNHERGLVLVRKEASRLGHVLARPKRDKNVA
ncbi:hypothetical protein PIB30_100127 [Stylosanthes scabra]|uniref:Uncharacterized protein n=1 Tax=Stylosanthes scabra TaxID=79078 RepID=A0ABU6RX37_9FABA|nr:hypothetical protein [Stylosanthes scabra]